MAEVIPQINIDGTKIKNTWTEKEYVTDEVYNALNKAVIDLKDNNNLLDSNSILFREEYNLSSKNLNNAIHQGVYSFTSSALNAPPNTNGGNLFVTNTSKINQGAGIIITQIAYCHNGNVYSRTKNTTENFTAWRQLAYTESPTFTGTPTSPTPNIGDSSTQIANTEWVQSWVRNFINSLSNNLQVDWSGNYFTVPALNISGNVSQNGYLKLGKLFGNIIFQWGSFYCHTTSQYFNFPISFPNNLFVVTEAHIVSTLGDFKTCSIIVPDKNGFTINSSDNGYVAHVIAIGN